MTLAMVFSVQQGEHGPLVVYKLQVPKRTTEGTIKPAPTLEDILSAHRAMTPARQPVGPERTPQKPVAVAVAPRLSTLEPSTLGTVVMPRSRSTAPQAAQPLSLLPEAFWVTPEVPALHSRANAEEVPPQYRVVLDAPSLETAGGEYPGKIITLEEVTRELEWRRQTRQRLPAPAGVPRF